MDPTYDPAQGSPRSTGQSTNLPMQSMPGSAQGVPQNTGPSTTPLMQSIPGSAQGFQQTTDQTTNTPMQPLPGSTGPSWTTGPAVGVQAPVVPEAGRPPQELPQPAEPATNLNDERTVTKLKVIELEFDLDIIEGRILVELGLLKIATAIASPVSDQGAALGRSLRQQQAGQEMNEISKRLDVLYEEWARVMIERAKTRRRAKQL